MAPGRDEVRASLVGGALGGVGLGVLLQTTTATVRVMGDMVGSPTPAAGWVVLLVTSLVFGVGYAFVVTRYVDQYVSAVLGLTSRSETLRGVVMPLTQRFGMALVVTTAMGLAYGCAVGVGFGVVVVPALASSVAGPRLEPLVVVGYLLYGGVLGGVYGKLVMG